MLFDTHINLHSESFDGDRDAILARARAEGITRFIAICDRLDRYPAVCAASDPHPDVWRSVGVHPHHAKDFSGLTAQDLIDPSADPKVCAIGETGLDQHYGYSDLSEQVANFRTHIEAAQETGLPIIIHTREADDLTGDLLEACFASSPFQMLLHCYTGGERLAKRALDLGAYFSVSGILSFKSAGDVRTVIEALPHDRVILETDCPYLAPIPHRGRRNEPAYLRAVCASYAKLIGESPEAVANRTTTNALRLFRRCA
jgi:TatD DNase family protein